MEAFLAAVRNACPVGLWSQGVRLAREGAVSIEARSPAEITARVRERGRAVPPTILLYVTDREWDCDCGSRLFPCAHIAAAAIVAAAPPEAEATAPSGPAPKAAPAATLAYRLTVEHGALRLARAIVDAEGTSTPLAMPLADRIARGITSPRLDPTHDDLRIDRILGRRAAADVPLAELGIVFEALVHARDVTLDGQKVSVSPEPVDPAARLRDAPRGGVELELAVPGTMQVVAFGVGKVGGTVRPLAQTDRYGLRFERLPLRRTFAPEELGTLVGEVLPDLEKRGVVRVETKRLPRRDTAARPRIHFELQHQGRGLTVLPLLVYGDPPRARVDGGKLVLIEAPAPVRDEAEERALCERLRDLLSLVPGRAVTFEGRDAAAFITKLERFHGGDHEERERARPVLVPTIRVDGEHIDVEFEVPAPEGAEATPGADGFARRRVDLESVLDAWQSGLGLVAIDNGGMARLPADFLEKHGRALLDLVSVRDDEGRVPKTALPVVAEVATALGLDVPRVVDRLAPLVAGFDGIPHAPLPADLDAELRHYQQRGVDWLCFLRDAELGGLLADDMGLGKTIQALAALRGRCLVVCPRSVVHNWAAEIRRFRPGLRVARYEGASRKLDPKADVTLVTYGILRSDVDKFGDVTWDVMVLDEAQAIKNPDSQVARAAVTIPAKARFALTGTPVENRLEELWSAMRFACPGLLGPRSDFVERYARPIEGGDAEAAARLRARIRPFLLRRLKADVLPELPSRTESVLYCELDETERAAYDVVRAATQKEVVQKLAEGASVLLALEALLRLRQASCHRGLLPGQEAPSSSKIERLVEALTELTAEGHRALVFSQWTSLLDRVEPHITAAGLAFGRLDGSTRDREGVVNAFQAPDGPHVLLLSLKAGGSGLNLTAADHVFLLDPWWNPAVEEQAADRAHRIGQDKPVFVYRLVAKDTVEEGILALQERKRQLAQAAVGDASGAAAITREDLLALLEGA